jgi:hypothetical protein
VEARPLAGLAVVEDQGDRRSVRDAFQVAGLARAGVDHWHGSSPLELVVFRGKQ